MNSTLASTFHRIASIAGGLALVVGLVGCGGHGGSRVTAPLTPTVTTVARTIAEAPAGGPLTISSPAFADGAPIPVQYTCKGASTAPPLVWSAPLGGALVVDDPDAPRGPYVHWVVTGIAPGSGSTADGQTPAGGSVPAKLRRPVGIWRALPASGHRDTSLPVHSLPASEHLPTPVRIGRGASGASHSAGRDRTGLAYRNIRSLTMPTQPALDVVKAIQFGQLVNATYATLPSDLTNAAGQTLKDRRCRLHGGHDDLCQRFGDRHEPEPDRRRSFHRADLPSGSNGRRGDRDPRHRRNPGMDSRRRVPSGAVPLPGRRRPHGRRFHRYVSVVADRCKAGFVDRGQRPSEAFVPQARWLRDDLRAQPGRSPGDAARPRRRGEHDV